MSHKSSGSFVLSIFIAMAVSAFGQVRSRVEPDAEAIWGAKPPVTVKISKDQVRLTALALTQSIRLEVLSPIGEPVYDSGFRPGNRFDWSAEDQQALRMSDGIYGCVVTVENLNGQVSHRRGIFRIKEGAVSSDAVNQQPAAAGSGEQESLTILGAGEPAPFTIVSHDGQEGWIESASGGLSFNAGSPSRSRDAVPHLRLTPEGNLGIGVAEPQAKLDVAGLIRASDGFQFSDGTILKMENGAPVLVIERSQGEGGTSPGATGKTTRVLAAGGNVGVVLASSGSPGRVLGSEGGSSPYNVIYGNGAGASSTGTYNSFFGINAGNKNTTGSQNAFFGAWAGANNVGGTGWQGGLNSFFGEQAGNANTTGQTNSFFGGESGYLNTTGSSNAFLGYAAGFYNTSGSGNTFIGDEAGYSPGNGNTVENNNTFIGARTLGIPGITNTTAIGYAARVTQSNSLVLGSIYGVNGGPADTKVGIGTTAPVSHFNVASTSTASPRGVTNEQYNNGMDGVQFRARKARGTPSAPAAVQSGDVMGNYVFDGHDGSTFGTGVQIRPVAEENWSPTAHGAYLALWTTPPGTTTNTERVRITGSGNVGIGTSAPAERLHVNGNIRLSGTIITGAPEEPVPDYVFGPDYKLMPIEELQKFVQKEKHLPNFPNAETIRQKGLNLGEFQMKLLQKIEELTLYTLQQGTTIQAQQNVIHDHKTKLEHKDAKIADLEKQNSRLELRLAALEQMMQKLSLQKRK